MGPSVRVFAWELAKTTLRKENKNGPGYMVVTPGGACCLDVFIVGALTRVDRFPDGSAEAWVSDPTGTFSIVVGRQESAIQSQLESIETPAFVTVSGEVQPGRGSRNSLQVRPFEIRETDRTVRDTWVIRTAEITLDRLELMEKAIRGRPAGECVSSAVSHYAPDNSAIRSMVAMVEEALKKVDTVRGGPICAPDPREIILDLIKNHSGPRGIEVASLVLLAGQKGVRDEQVMTVVRQLVEEDECYQPGSGLVKLL